MAITEDNRDNGSLHTGATRPRVGDRIQLVGESSARHVTYVMGSAARGWHACFKKQGAVPVGRVQWELIGADASKLAALAEADAISENDSPPTTDTEPDGHAKPLVTIIPRLRPLTPAIDADVLVHADWSGNANARERSEKRQQVRADRDGSKYRVGAPQRVEDAGAWLERLVDEARAGAAVVLGFDFVVGVPEMYAKIASIASFTDFVRTAPDSFFSLNADVRTVSVRQPFFPKNSDGWSTVAAPKGAKLSAVAKAIGVDDFRDLLRRCEQRTETRDDASPLFLTSGAKQVGRAAAFGWQEVIRPALERHPDIVRLWPFHGDLHELVHPGTLTIVETYPAETYAHLGIGGSSRKRNQSWRRDATRRMLAVAGESVMAEPGLQAAADDGFGPSEDGEDSFDALVGALGMVLVAVGRDSARAPKSSVIREIEGWILGLEVDEPGTEP